MLTRSLSLSRFIRLTAGIFLLLAVAPSMAANLTWDSGGATAGNPADGPGNWDTLTAWWSNGTSDVVWDNVSTAVFGHANGAAGTVTIDDVSGTVTAAGLTFNAPGSGSYVITGSGADTLTLSGLNPIIAVAPGVSANISAPIAGGFGSYALLGSSVTGLVFKDTGTSNTGTFTISGSSTYTGSTIFENSGLTGSGGSGISATLSSNASLGSAGSNVYVAFNPASALTDTSSLTMTGSSSLTASTLVLDYNFGQGTTSTTAGGVLNVNGNNTINADTISTTAGRNGGNTKGGLGTLKLGSGATLTLNGANGIGNNVALIDISNYSFETGGSTTTGAAGLVDFSAGTVNGTVNEIDIATGKAGSSGSSGASTGELDFANGTLNIANVIRIARTGRQPANGTLTLAAGGTGTLTAASITFGETGPTGTSSATGIININGATLAMTGDINNNPSNTSNTTTGTINLNGGTLDMGGHAIGSSGKAVTLNATAGLLNNVSSINSTGNGSQGLTMSGTGAQVLTLTGTNSYNGDTTVNGGTLVANGPQSMGNGNGALAVNGGTLDLFGNGQSVQSLSGTGAGAIITNSVASPATLTISNGGGIGTGVYAGLIQDGGSGKTVGFTVSGGTQTLTSTTPQTYTGNTTVSGGATLSIANINSTSNAYVNGTLNAAGTMGAILVDNGGMLTPGPAILSNTTGLLNATSLTIGSGGGNLSFLANSGTPGTGFDQLSLSGAATLNSSITVNVNMSGSMPSGTYALVSATGGLHLNGNSVFGNVNIGGGATRTTGSVSETSSQIDLVVTGNAANLTWTGTGDGTTWDIVGQTNWTSTAPTDPNKFYNEDNVTFNNISSNLTVNVAASVQPGSVTFNNDASHSYVFNGNGIADSGSGTNVTLNGAGSVTFNNFNTYAGATNVNNGQLIIGSGGTIAGTTLAIAGPGTVTVNNGGQTTTAAITNAGNFSVGGSVGGTALGSTGTLTITSGGNISTTTATVSGGTATIQSSGNLSSPTLDVTGGSVTAESGGTISSTTISVSNGASLTAQSGASISNTPNLTNNGSVTFNSDQFIHALSGTNAAAILQETGTLTVSATGTFAGSIQDDGPGSLTVSAGTLTLTGSNSYTGNTTINSGATLQIDTGSNTGSLSATTNISDSGTLIYARTGSQSVPNTLTGAGAFRQIGGDTMTLTAADNSGFSGAIQAYNGTILQTSATSLGSGAGGLILGTPEPAGGPTNTPVGNITLISSVPTDTVGSISSTSGGTTVNPTPNVLTIPSGVTLTDSGTLTVGPNDTTAAAAVYTTLQATGGGSLIVSGNTTVAQANGIAVLDLSGLNSVTINSATFNMYSGAGLQATVNLANTTVGRNAPSNSISSTTINMATTGTNNPNGNASVLNLGSGSNSISASTINLGTGRGAGVIQFTAGAPSTANLTLTGSPTINMAIASTNGTQTAATAALNFAGYGVNVQAGSINMAENTANLAGGGNAAITFDTGTFTPAPSRWRSTAAEAALRAPRPPLLSGVIAPTVRPPANSIPAILFWVSSPMRMPLPLARQLPQPPLRSMAGPLISTAALPTTARREPQYQR